LKTDVTWLQEQEDMRLQHNPGVSADTEQVQKSVAKLRQWFRCGFFICLFYECLFPAL